MRQRRRCGKERDWVKEKWERRKKKNVIKIRKEEVQ